MLTATVRDLATASGLELARLIDTSATTSHRMSDADRLEVVKATARLDAWTATMRAQAILAVHDSARDDIAATTPSWSHATADRAPPARPTPTTTSGCCIAGSAWRWRWS